MNQSTQKKKSPLIDTEILTRKAIDRIEDIFNHFDIPFQRLDNKIVSACPIHEGDGQDKLNLFTEGDNCVGNWKCFSGDCHEEWGKNFFGFMTGMLTRKLDKDVSYGQAIGWTRNFLNLENSDLKVDNYQQSSQNFIRSVDKLTRERYIPIATATRTQIREKLQIPADYFIQRGFSVDILDKYDVGLCIQKDKPMSGRIVVPVYDDDYNFMVGCIGRSINKQCEVCNRWHGEDSICPTNSYEQWQSCKWINNKGFQAESMLYNYWFARKHINEMHAAILVEGQGDVWKLEEAGIHIGLGMFGTSLTEQQAILLEHCELMNLIIITDNDEAGVKGRESILKRCKRFYNCHTVNLAKKDLGDMSVEEIQELLEPILKKVNKCRQNTEIQTSTSS